MTLRDNTERPITVLKGTNVLVGTDPDKIRTVALDVLVGKKKTWEMPPLWDGKAAERIVHVLLASVPRRETAIAG